MKLTLRWSCALLFLFLGLSACSSTDPGTGDGGVEDQPWLRIDPTWSSIYDGYFGPTGVGSCSSGKGCHTSADDAGTKASNFLCVDKDGCHASLTGTSNLVRPSDVKDPTRAPLLGKLRQAGGKGKMPSSSAFVFHPEDISVLEAWIAKGANND
ncbi:MAG: hypothetical protein ABI193_19115 [Minicystis sp.]